MRVVTELEQGAATLEESLALWERGEALAKRCEEWLIGAKARLDAARAAAPSRERLVSRVGRDETGRPIVAELGRPETPEETAARKAERARKRRANQTARQPRRRAGRLARHRALARARRRAPGHPTARDRSTTRPVAADAQAGVDAPLARARRCPTAGPPTAPNYVAEPRDGITTWYDRPDHPRRAVHRSCSQGIDANESWVAEQLETRRPTGDVTIDGIDLAGLRPPRRRRPRQPRLRDDDHDRRQHRRARTAPATDDDSRRSPQPSPRTSTGGGEPTSQQRTPAQVWQEMVRGNERFVAGEPRHPRQDVERREELAGAQAPARRPVRLQRLPAGRRDHLRQGPRRPVRRAQRRPGDLRLGGRLARVRGERARTCRSSSCSATTSAAPCAPRSTPTEPDAAPLPPHIAQPDRTDPARRCERVRAPTAMPPDRLAGGRPRAPARHRRRAAASAPSSSATRSPRVRWLSSARTTGCSRARAVPDVVVGDVGDATPDHRERTERTRRREHAPTEYRIEHDTMGEVRVPASALYRRADPARRRELPDLRHRPRAGPDRRPRPHQARRRDRQRRARHRSTSASPTPSSPPPTRSSPASTTTTSRSTSTRPARGTSART